MDASIPAFVQANYEIKQWRHVAILKSDFTKEWREILQVLSDFRLYPSEIMSPGGRKSGVSTRIDGALTGLG